MASHETFDIPIGKVVGPKGDTGTGIKSIKLLSTSGLVKTYRITMTDDTTFDFVVTDGNGITGASFDAQTNALTLTFDNGTSFTTPSLKGTKGDTGTGISKIEKTGTDGLVDTYTVTYTDGQTFTYTVTNGADGVSPEVTVTQISGGHTVEIEDADGVKTFNVLDGEVTEARMAEALATKAPVILETVSGAIASFDDGADGMPVKKLVAQIEPVQDLHGYDNPWPAGGGKNLVPMTTLDDIKAHNTSGTWNGADYSRNGITFTVLTDNAGNVLGFKINGTSTEGASIQVKGTDDFTLAAGSYYYTGVSENNSGYDLNLRKAGTTTDIVQRGDAVTLTLEEDTSFSSMYIWVYSGKTLTNAYVYPMIRNSSVSDATFAPYSNECPISGHTGAEIKQTGKNLVDISNQISVNWETEAGTVYGGSDEVIGGALADNMVSLTFNGSENWEKHGSLENLYYVTIASGLKQSVVAPHNLSNMLVQTTAEVVAMPYNSFKIDTNGSRLVLRIDCGNDVTLFKQFLNSNNLQIVAEAKTPIEYTLTPTELTTLYGTNNIWSSTGDTEVTYPADTKLFIEKLTQPTEDDMTADHAIASGTFFMVGNTLYLATSQIAAGGTITPGTNATKLSLADALNQLNA